MSHPRELDNLDIEGVFWPTADPDREIAGRLTFEPTTGGRLRLIGRSFDIMPVADGYQEPIRFNGESRTASYTLDGCFPVRNHYPLNRPADVVFQVPTILSNFLFEDDDALDFHSIRVCLRHLEPWLAIRRLSAVSHGEIVREGHDTIPAQSSVSVGHPETESISLPGGDLALRYEYEIDGDEYTSMTLSQRGLVRFVPTSAKGIDDLLEMTGALQQLLTIATDSPSVYTDVRLEHQDVTRFREDDPFVEDHVKLFAQLRGSGLGGSTSSPDPRKMLFTFDDVGRMEGIAKWIDLYQRYRVALEPLLAHKYQATSYVGNLLLDAAGAADAYYLLRFGREPNAASTLRDRLIALVAIAGDLFRRVIGSPEKWATHVKSARTDLAHAGDRDPPRYNDAAYSALARSVYLVVILCLLREMDVAEAVINKAIAARFATLASRLHLASGGVQPSGRPPADQAR